MYPKSVMAGFGAMLVGGLMLSAATSAQAALLTCEPDNFAPLTLLNSACTGVTLSAVGPGFSAGPDVFAIDSASQGAEPFTASTGRLVFGTDSQTFPHLWREPFFSALRADFASLTDSVQIDFISNDAADFGLLQVFGVGDVLLDTYMTASLSTNQFETMVINRMSADIAYILASAVTSADSGGLDHLRWQVQIPEPGTLALFGLGLAGLGLARRRKAAWVL